MLGELISFWRPKPLYSCGPPLYTGNTFCETTWVRHRIRQYWCRRSQTVASAFAFIGREDAKAPSLRRFHSFSFFLSLYILERAVCTHTNIRRIGRNERDVAGLLVAWPCSCCVSMRERRFFVDTGLHESRGLLPWIATTRKGNRFLFSHWAM